MNEEELKRVMDLIRKRYKSFESPDFSFVGDAMSRRPYEKTLQQIGKSFHIEEETDPNDDVSFGYLLRREEKQWVLLLSMLGPYAVLFRIDESGRVKELLTHIEQAASDSEKELVTILSDNSICLMGREMLLIPVPISLSNAETENTRVYQALFTDTDILPWEEIL
jgi:hypothetical protein